jgi:hypothetical protein
MNDDWMQVLASGQFDEWLHNLTIVRPGEDTVEGYGRMKWTDDGFIEIEAHTVISDIFATLSSNFRLGIVPRNEHYTLKARTQDGWEVEVSHIVTSPSASMTQGLAHWKFKPQSLSLIRPREGKDRTLRALLGPFKQIVYPRMSNMTDDAPCFGGNWSRRDWMKLDASFGTVFVRRSGEDHAIIQIDADLDIIALTNVLYSVQQAMSFVEGRNVRLIGYESLCDGQHHRKISKDVGMTKNSFVPPLGWMPDSLSNCESLLTLATNFFHTERAKAYTDRLRM